VSKNLIFDDKLAIIKHFTILKSCLPSYWCCFHYFV